MIKKNCRTNTLRIASVSLLSAVLGFLSGCGKSSSSPFKDQTVAASVCDNQLKQIADAKQLWAQQNNKSAEDTPTMADIAQFMRGGTTCPGGGTYTIGKVGELPKCSIADHQALFEKRLKDEQAGAQQ